MKARKGRLECAIGETGWNWFFNTEETSEKRLYDVTGRWSVDDGGSDDLRKETIRTVGCNDPAAAASAARRHRRCRRHDRQRYRRVYSVHGNFYPI